jgi:transketolase
VTLRPGDANEVAEAWRWVMEQQHTPSALILSRQNLPTLRRRRSEAETSEKRGELEGRGTSNDEQTFAAASGLRKGAYTLIENGAPDVILIGTGSEVSLCIEAYNLLVKDNVKARVVSMPSWELFEAQSEEYKESVLPNDIRARVTVEQASRFGWERYAGRTGAMIGMLGFGASAPLKDLQKKFGFLPERVVDAAKEQLRARSAGREQRAEK